MPISRQYAGYRSTASPYRCCASHNSNCADATANTHSTVHSLPDTDPNAHANKAFAEVATLSIHARVISIPVSPLLVPPRPPKSLILEPVLSKFKHGELDPVEPFGAGQSNFFVCVFVRTRTSRPRQPRKRSDDLTWLSMFFTALRRSPLRGSSPSEAASLRKCHIAWSRMERAGTPRHRSQNPRGEGEYGKRTNQYFRTLDVTPFLFPPHWRPYGTAMNVTTLPGRVVLPHT